MKTYSVSEFKTHLSEALRLVKAGTVLEILEHSRPVARVLPLETHRDIRIRTALRKFTLPKTTLHIKIDPLDLLEEERSRR